MMKPRNFTHLVIATTLLFTGCATSDIQKKLENNFIYQCSLKLFEDLERKVTGADAEKICTAAHNEEKTKLGQKVIDQTMAAMESPTPTPTISPSPAKSNSTDEVKPEATSKF